MSGNMAIPREGFLTRNLSKVSLEPALREVVTRQKLGINVNIELSTIPDIVTFSERVILSFRVQSNINEEEHAEEGGLPFNIRVKALLSIICDTFPVAFEKVTFTVRCAKDPSASVGDHLDRNGNLALTIRNLEKSISSLSGHGTDGRTVRFGIEGTSTHELRRAGGW